MKKYKSFLIVEKLNQIQLLLEGYLDYSPRFSEKLFDISDKSKLAEFLHDLESEYLDDDKLTQNYIDTTDREDMVSYVPQDRYDKSLSENPDSIKDPYTMKGRGETRIGRLVRGLCSLVNHPVTDQEIEQFVNLYKSKVVSTDETWELVSGEKIKYWYNEENYLEGHGNGPLGRSCMADEESQDFFDIYINSDSCQLLILTKKDDLDDKKLIGRALVWKPTKSSLSRLEGVEYFMDRVYCMKDSDEVKFNNYADEKGFLRKKRNNSDNNTGMIFLLKGNEVRCKLVVDVDGDCDEYPYIDTLKFLNSDKNELSNIGYHNGYELEDTDGNCDHCSDCDGSGYKECESCGDDEEIECLDCDGSGYESCYRCEGNGTIECRKCSGNGKQVCDNCEGEGEVELDGEMVECPECDGSRKVDCEECDGEGLEECPDCEGGKDDCSACDGSGKVDCDECGGGKPLCPECTGLISKL